MSPAQLITEKTMTPVAVAYAELLMGMFLGGIFLEVVAIRSANRAGVEEAYSRFHANLDRLSRSGEAGAATAMELESDSASSAKAKSEADWKRCSGLFSRHR